MEAIRLKVEKAKKGKPRGNPDKTAPFRFKPGQSGNPGGRPKGAGSKKISEAYSAALMSPVPAEVREKLGIDTEADCSWADLIAIQMVRKSVEVDGAKVNFSAVTELRETTEGKTADKQEVSGAGGVPLNVPTYQVNFVKPKRDEDVAATPTEE
jgi:hypothetical protein